MQGIKKFTPKLFVNFQLPDHIPEACPELVEGIISIRY